MIFIFDLDGTLTECETLPIIAKHFNVEANMDKLTKQTIRGDIPFMESFINRVDILGNLDIETISLLLADIPITEEVQKFINTNSDDCLIATGNYRGWISKLTDRFNCVVHASEGVIHNERLKLTKILRKEELVKTYQDQGKTVVFIGDGNNDAEAMRIADISIACGIVHPPAKSVIQVADYAVYSPKALVRLLNQIKKPQAGKSVVISAAGIGSRLGLGQTKSLIPILGRSLISYQLGQFADIEDIRIVVGYQAVELIKEVCALRADIVFAFNHDYFHTKTGASLYLGARHANQMVIAWDGDLLIHPDDIQKCLTSNEEYIGISEKTTEESVFVNLDVQGNVIGFSRVEGDYEWSGPACLRREHISFTTGHVYEQIEPLLPIPAKINRARDIDTYEDYKNAIEFVESWRAGNFKIDEYYSKLAENITSAEQTRNKAPDFSKYDVEFVKRFAGKTKTLLDLGAGTGLLINHLVQDFAEIVALEKYKNFSDFIVRADNVQVLNADLIGFKTNQQFDVITVYGVMNFFNADEALKIYRRVCNWLKPGGKLLVKHQMGRVQDVIVDGVSTELTTRYYSEYRWVENEVKLLSDAGFHIDDVVDIYPPEFNRWDNTKFYALECSL